MFWNQILKIDKLENEPGLNRGTASPVANLRFLPPSSLRLTKQISYWIISDSKRLAAMFCVVFYLQMTINDFCEPHLTTSSLMPSEIHLSPYLRLGCLSPRLLYQRMTQEYIKVYHSLRHIKNISVIILSDPAWRWFAMFPNVSKLLLRALLLIVIITRLNSSLSFEILILLSAGKCCCKQKYRYIVVAEVGRNCWHLVSGVAWENSRHFAQPPLVSPRNDVWGTSAEILLWWRVTIQIWFELFIGWSKFPSRFSPSNQKHYPDAVFTRHQYGISAFVPQTSFRGETSGSVAKCRLFSSGYDWSSSWPKKLIFFKIWEKQIMSWLHLDVSYFAYETSK